MLTKEEAKSIPEIEWFLWKDGSQPGYVQIDRGRTPKEIMPEVVDTLKKFNLYDELDYFSMPFLSTEKDTPLPNDLRFIACYAVRGSNEGHYIHVDAIGKDEASKTIFLGKTFLGMEHALKVAEVLTYLFWGYN